MAFFLCCFTFYWDGDWYIAQKSAVSIFVSIGIAGYFFRKYGLVAASLALYLVAGIIFVVYWNENHFVTLTLRELTLLRLNCMMGAFSTLLLSLFVSEEVIERRSLEKCFLGFGIYLCAHFLFLKNYLAPQGPLLTQSTSGVFLALLIPMAWRNAKWLAGVFLVTAFLTKGHTAIAAACASSIGLLITELGVTKKFWKWAAVGILIAIFAVWLIAHFNPYWLTNDSYRFRGWTPIWNWWQKRPEIFHFLGMGPGTVFTVVPKLHEAMNVDIGQSGVASMWVDGLLVLKQYKVGMTFLHNEPFQFYMEIGYVGLALVTLLYLKALFSFPAFALALGAASLTMFPLRHDTFLLLVLFELHPYFRREHEQEAH